ncbi:MAG: RNA polymerase sigma factor [Bdellovibrionaceae bacterium]|nr:RNA polymerase sigma factor [Pseudobdellovibrionaceae bacterium]
MSSNDTELVALIIAQDDREAFESLLKKYQAPIRAFFRKMCGGDGELSDDLAQETFLKVYRHLSTFQGNSQLLTWIYSIARNVFYEHLRREEKFTELPESEEMSYTTRSEEKLDIAKCMLQLTPEERLILTMAYAQGLSQTEVSEVLEIPLGTVKTRTLQAKEKLRGLLQAYSERSL